MDVRAFCPSCAPARFGTWGQPVAPLVAHSMRLAGSLLYYSRLSARWCGTEALLSSEARWPVLYSLAKFALWQGGLALAAAFERGFSSRSAFSIDPWK